MPHAGQGFGMRLSEYLDETALCAHINNRVVNVQHHPALPLTIYNYGQKATFEGIWDDVTCKTRGLIVDRDNNVVARAFEKFFNLGTAYRPETDAANLPDFAPEVTEKLDGSLGILYRYKGFTGIATRGSFASDQARWASVWYDRHLARAAWPDGWTPVFEIIYPENRVVVKYEHEGLTLLSAVNNETGEEMRHADLVELGRSNECPVVQLFRKSLDECRAENTNNAEGYVLTWHFDGRPPLKVKVKFEEYVRLHHLMTGISPKEIWRMLQRGESFDYLLNDVPTHYAEWVNYWRAALTAEYGRIEQKAKAIWAMCPLPKDGKDRETRKQLASYFTNGDIAKVSGVLFKMLDAQPYDEVIWKMCRDMVTAEPCFRPADQ